MNDFNFYCNMHCNRFVKKTQKGIRQKLLAAM